MATPNPLLIYFAIMSPRDEKTWLVNSSACGSGNAISSQIGKRKIRYKRVVLTNTNTVCVVVMVGGGENYKKINENMPRESLK
jgi:hypothetical protein